MAKNLQKQNDKKKKTFNFLVQPKSSIYGERWVC